MVKHSEGKPGAAADVQAFRDAMQGVKPLAATATRVVPTPRKPRQPRRKAAAVTPGADLDVAMPLLSTASGAAIAPGEALLHRRPGVRDQVLRRLRRGLFPVEAELDLHGLSQSVARTLTAAFIDSACASNLRCVRIIHGKGMRSGARGAVLKSALNELLRRHPDVMAFSSARPIDGGTGAAYVLLRA